MKLRTFCKQVINAALKDCGVSYTDLAKRGHVTLQTVYSLLDENRNQSVPVWILFEMREMCPGIPWHIVESMCTCRSSLGYDSITIHMENAWQAARWSYGFLPPIPLHSELDW